MKNLITILMCAIVRCGICSDAAQPQHVADNAGESSSLAVAEPPELPLPQIPATLRTPAERAGYLINHFWDGMNFSDIRMSHDRMFMEQNFSTFISVFPHADESARRTAVGRLLKKAEADAEAYSLVTDIAEKYLYETDSPVYSEEYYILFLENIVESKVLGEYGTMRTRWQLETARKNRPGMTAADFGYTTPDGKNTTLGKTPVRDYLLVVFYDPTCDHCKEVMRELQNDSGLASCMADGRLTVLAIYSGDNRDMWRKGLGELPAGWRVGFESGEMQENGIYVLRMMPTLYLLDSNRRVLIKEATPQQVVQRVCGGE